MPVDASEFKGRAEEAAKICLIILQGMKHRDGHPASDHSFRVAHRVQEKFKDGDLTVIALLHDLIEDARCTYAYLLLLFGRRIADAVLDLTRGKKESWGVYIKRILKNPDAIRVKIADIEDNLERMDGKMAEHEPMYSVTLKALKKSL